MEMMETAEILHELEALATERMKKYYLSQGAREPVFGTPTGAMKPLLKRLGRHQEIAEALYATGCYDAMYLAGMIAEPKRMQPEDFDRWLESAYFHFISDYIVAVTLAEMPFAQEVALRWIRAKGERSADGNVFRNPAEQEMGSPAEPEMGTPTEQGAANPAKQVTGSSAESVQWSLAERTISAGWACFEWLIGTRKDAEFEPSVLLELLHEVEATIHGRSDHLKNVMNRFVIAVGLSFAPLHEEALKTADRIGRVALTEGKKPEDLPDARESILKEVGKGRLGFKRRHVRC